MDSSIGKNPAPKLSKLTDLQQELKLLLEKKENIALMMHSYEAKKPFLIRRTGWGEALTITIDDDKTGSVLEWLFIIEQNKILKRIKEVNSIMEHLDLLIGVLDA